MPVGCVWTTGEKYEKAVNRELELLSGNMEYLCGAIHEEEIRRKLIESICPNLKKYKFTIACHYIVYFDEMSNCFVNRENSRYVDFSPREFHYLLDGLIAEVKKENSIANCDINKQQKCENDFNLYQISNTPRDLKEELICSFRKCRELLELFNTFDSKEKFDQKIFSFLSSEKSEIIEAYKIEYEFLNSIINNSIIMNSNSVYEHLEKFKFYFDKIFDMISKHKLILCIVYTAVSIYYKLLGFTTNSGIDMFPKLSFDEICARKADFFEQIHKNNAVHLLNIIVNHS